MPKALHLQVPEIAILGGRSQLSEVERSLDAQLDSAGSMQFFEGRGVTAWWKS